MKSWEFSRNIIAFFQSYPQIFSETFSFYSTVISQNIKTYNIYHSNFDNPETKSDPYEIVEEILQLLNMMPQDQISIDLITNIDYISSDRHQAIFTDYIAPMLQALANHANIYEFSESDVDIFSLRGLFDQVNRQIIPEMVNTVIYV